MRWVSMLKASTELCLPLVLALCPRPMSPLINALVENRHWRTECTNWTICTMNYHQALRSLRFFVPLHSECVTCFSPLINGQCLLYVICTKSSDVWSWSQAPQPKHGTHFTFSALWKNRFCVTQGCVREVVKLGILRSVNKRPKSVVTWWGCTWSRCRRLATANTRERVRSHVGVSCWFLADTWLENTVMSVSYCAILE